MPAIFNKRFGPPVFWAGLVGFLLGILFSVTVWSTNRIIQIRSGLPDEGGAIADNTTHLTLNLATPSSGSVVSADAVNLSGSTSSPAIIVLSGGAADTVVDSGNTKFQTSYKLKEGENEIQVTAVDAAGNETSSVLNVMYIAENIQ